MKRALITGITGQDGSYLAELLLSKGYEVYGLLRRKSTEELGNAGHLVGKVHFLYGEMSDITSLMYAIKDSNPDEIYNLAAQSFVSVSWREPLFTTEVNGMGVLNLLEAVKLTKPVISPHAINPCISGVNMPAIFPNISFICAEFCT